MASLPFRLLILLPGLCASFAAAAPAPAPRLHVAITVDDLPIHGALPPGETRIGVARRMVAALKAARLRRVYGFVNGGNVADLGGETVLRAWRGAGFPLGNHTWSHPNANALPASAYEADIARNEPLIARLMGKRARRWFRYPYLAQGDDPGRRAEIRRFLAARNYRIAAVTVDFGDYAWNEPYARCAEKGDDAAIESLERSYLDGARESIAGARNLARALYGRDIDYVLLLHIGAFDARMLPRLLALFRQEGFGFTSLARAERDPAYADDVDPSSGAGPWTLAQRATARGIAVPPLMTRLAGLDSVCR
jgi:peptidoglycan/xylan/chitin deacetylase (PgdA/CDA1 family)